MARRVTMEMSRERANAWLHVAGGQDVRQKLGVYIIRGPGQLLVRGSANPRSALSNDGDQRRLLHQARQGAAYGFKPDIHTLDQVVVPSGFVGVYFISEPTLIFDGLIKQVDARLGVTVDDAVQTEHMMPDVLANVANPESAA